MSARLIKQPTVGTSVVIISRERAEFKSRMVMLRFDVDSAIADKDRDRGEYIYSQLMEQMKKLSREFGFVLNLGQ